MDTAISDEYGIERCGQQSTYSMDSRLVHFIETHNNCACSKVVGCVAQW